jgi:hypothetical protein
MKALRFLVLVVAASAFTFPANDVKLLYSFKQGDQYDYVQSAKQTIKQTIPGMGDVITEVDTDGALILTVTELTSMGARLKAEYTKLKVLTKSSVVNVNMDSEGPDTDMQNKIVKSMMNKPFYYTLSKNGTVEKVEGAENIYSGLGSLGLDQATLDATKKSMQQMLSEKTMKTSLEMGLIKYPENKIKPNDSWKNTAELDMNFALKLENTWNLKKVEGDIASIEGDGIMTTPNVEQVITLPNGFKSKSDLSGKQAVVGKVSIKSGWPISIKVLSEIKGKMTLLAGNMLPEDMDVPMEITTESTYTITKR